MDGNFNETKEEAIKSRVPQELKYLPPRRSKIYRRATLYAKSTKTQRLGGTP